MNDEISTKILPFELNSMTPNEFELFVGRLLESMGFLVKVTQASRDGGIDCVILDNTPLKGCGKAIVQVRRYTDNPVGEPAVRDLYGVLHHEKAGKAILITTSSFTSEAFKFAADKPIELIDGRQLQKLVVNSGMFDNSESTDPVVDSEAWMESLAMKSLECSNYEDADGARYFAQRAVRIFEQRREDHLTNSEPSWLVFYALGRAFHGDFIAGSYYFRAWRLGIDESAPLLASMLIDWALYPDDSFWKDHLNVAARIIQEQQLNSTPVNLKRHFAEVFLTFMFEAKLPSVEFSHLNEILIETSPILALQRLSSICRDRNLPADILLRVSPSIIAINDILEIQLNGKINEPDRTNLHFWLFELLFNCAKAFERSNYSDEAKSFYEKAFLNADFLWPGNSSGPSEHKRFLESALLKYKAIHDSSCTCYKCRLSNSY
mgnify:CR=1 FL=1